MKSLHALVEFARMEHRQHHELVEVRTVALDARPLAHDRTSAIAADDVIGLDVLNRTVAGLMDDADANAGCVLRDILGGPAKPRIDQRQACHPAAQDAFEAVLRQAIVFLEVIVAEDFAALEVVPVVAHQAAISDNARRRDFRRQHSLRAHLVDAAPEIEMLERALRQVLALRDVVHPHAPLDQRARYSALGEIDGQPDAHRAAADNDDLISLAHARS